jgi:hypothetical protein
MFILIVHYGLKVSLRLKMDNYWISSNNNLNYNIRNVLFVVNLEQQWLAKVNQELVVDSSISHVLIEQWSQNSLNSRISIVSLVLRIKVQFKCSQQNSLRKSVCTLSRTRRKSLNQSMKKKMIILLLNQSAPLVVPKKNTLKMRLIKINGVLIIMISSIE